MFFDVFSFLLTNTSIQPDKAYSRDTTLRGRVKIHLKKDDKTPINAEIHNSSSSRFADKANAVHFNSLLRSTENQLLLKLAEWIPKHPSRSGGGAASAAQSGGKKKKGKGGK
jgi:hypothetical protein